MEKLKIAEIESEVKRKKIKNIYISINSLSGEVCISAPLKMSLHAIEVFFASKIAWIRKHKEKISTLPARTVNNYVSDERIELFGKKYTLKVFNYAAAPKVFFNFDSVDMYISPQSDVIDRKKAMDEFYKIKLEEIVPSFVLKWEEKLGIYTEPDSLKFLFKSMRDKLNWFGSGIEKDKVILRNPVIIGYKRLKDRWGLCHISDKKIILNVELAKKSVGCIEYVTAHELLHLKERKHNKRFKEYMKKAFPDWRKFEDELKGYI
ncbi:MAG: M48 family metallopeptidase [Endomicrobium sp.]|jgi:predicted metal-dependent hydrolase|nr:M48 family metallopeptidase [Endomicrobium sp.]